jgi:hypothetical protein
MTDWVSAAVQVLTRVHYVRETCGTLPDNIASLELKLQCLLQVQKQHKVNMAKSPATQSDDTGIWEVLDNFIHQMIEALDEMAEFLAKSKGSTKEQLLEYVKTFSGLGGNCEGFNSLTQRLCDHLQVVLFSVQAIQTGDISHEMQTTNELLRAILDIQRKKHDEIDKNIATLRTRTVKERAPVPMVDEKENDEDELQESLKNLMKGKEGKLTTVRKKKRNSIDAAGHRKRTSIVQDNLFADPQDIEKQAEQAANLGRQTLKRPFVEIDSEDTEKLRMTLKLERGVSLTTIQQELEKRGIDISIVPKAQCGFMEIKHKSIGLKKVFKKNSYKVRWIVHNPGTSYISLYRSPYDVDCKPEHSRIFLKQSKIKNLKAPKKDGKQGTHFAAFESSLGFVLEQYDGQQFCFRTNDPNSEVEWKNTIESVTTKSVPAI